MPRPKGAGKGATEVIGLRLEKEVVAYYRTKANEAGLSLSQFLKQTLMAGLAAESFERLRSGSRPSHPAYLALTWESPLFPKKPGSRCF